MHKNHKIKVGLVQINNSFSNQNYFPYSVGILQAYAQKYFKNPDFFEFLLPIYSRIPIKNVIEKLQDADIVFFSTYVWNMRISQKIAEEIKKKKPETIIVFGGPQVPNQANVFLKENNFIDIVCHGEGEKPFVEILENYDSHDWSKIPSISFINELGITIQNQICERNTDINTIPSPYLTGVFDPLIKANPQEEWIALWETNRGCPFSCDFCVWGGNLKKKIVAYDLERIYNEIDWFSKHSIEFIYCCDANYGILPRDIDIAKYMAENKRKYGYPKAFSVQNTKNSTDRSYEIQKILSTAGLNKGVTLSVQSMNEDTLKSVNRYNISNDVFQNLQKKFTADGIQTYTDVILGLPNETYKSYKKGVSQLIKNGQHNRIQFNNLTALVNSKLNEPEYREKYGLVTQETKIINIHGEFSQNDDIYETQNLVIETKTMPKSDWVKARAFSWMVALLHFDKTLQIPLIILNSVGQLTFEEIFEIFTVDQITSPTISGIYSFFIDKAIDIQNGGAEYCHSKEWLNLWWPADEFILIKLCTEHKLDTFYKESKQEIERYLQDKKIELPDQLLNDTFKLNRDLIKLPFIRTDKKIKLRYNLYEVYEGALKGVSIPLEENLYHYHIKRNNEIWSSWEEWCKKVVWYENKKGAYLYSCSLLK